jgi:hypothetical protein
MNIPQEYQEGYERARVRHPEHAARYVRNTLIGDPAADTVIEALAKVGAAQRQHLLTRGIEGGADAIPDAPPVVREFFADLEVVPAWFDPEFSLVGSRAFYRHSNMFLAAFVGAVLIEGFSTLISKSFGITGMIIDQGERRLKQNNRHVAEIFLPGGLARHGDGWKLSVRIRMIHAQARYLLGKSTDWDAAAWGLPLSAAHQAYGAATFSGLLLKHTRKLGVQLSKEERQSFMMIWRYSAHLMGIVPDMLFETEDDAIALYELGMAIEPPPSVESCQMAHALINGAPIVAGLESVEARRKLARRIYRISRALIGDARADQLRYPPSITFGALPLLRFTNRAGELLQRHVPALARKRRMGQFQMMIDMSNYEKEGIRYRVPEHVHAEKDAPL